MSQNARTRTGCRTCRRRHKKCDGRKPMCTNCEKTNLVCEGFPPKVLWQRPHEEVNLLSWHASRPNVVGVSSSSFDSTSASDDQDVGYGMIQEQNLRLFHQMSTGLRGHDARAFNTLDNGYDNGVETIYTSTGLPAVSQASQSLFSTVIPARDFYNMPSRAGEFPQELPHPSQIPPELPLLISNVETATQQRLISHFARNMSQVLVVSSTECKPMITVLIQLASHDQTVMDSVLCLSASHLLRLLGPSAGKELLIEKKRLHDLALQAQVQRTQILMQSAMPALDPYLGQKLNMLFATSILLCLFEICEGTGDNACQLHLDVARRIIAFLSRAPERKRSSNTVNHIVSDIDPFLLEFFVYHDTIASVTLTRSDLDQHYVYQASTGSCPDVTMIGVQDGLVGFFPRIAAIRDEAKANECVYQGNVLSKAITVWEELNSWKHKSTFSPDYIMIAELYRWSLFIWLVSIINPDQRSERKTQDVVQRITSSMSEIKDDVRACLLFPLFVVGSAAISREDRGIVEWQFQKQREWSNLGNVDLSYQIVKMIWEHGNAGSWDWMSLLKKHNMSFLVT